MYVATPTFCRMYTTPNHVRRCKSGRSGGVEVDPCKRTTDLTCVGWDSLARPQLVIVPRIGGSKGVRASADTDSRPADVPVRSRGASFHAQGRARCHPPSGIQRAHACLGDSSAIAALHRGASNTAMSTIPEHYMRKSLLVGWFIESSSNRRPALANFYECGCCVTLVQISIAAPNQSTPRPVAARLGWAARSHRRAPGAPPSDGWQPAR